MITGPRQAGKTTLMLMLKADVEKEGKKTVFLNLDIEADRQHFVSQEQLIRKIILEVGKSGGYVFIDEIQRKTDAGVFLKGIYDMNLPYKLIVSGSGSVELKEKLHESLVGRKRQFSLTTLTFPEFVDYKTDYRYENRLLEFFQTEKSRTKLLFEEYLNFGGYPRVVLEETFDAKLKTIADLYHSYIERDISLLLGVKRPDDFTSLVRIMASQVGGLANSAELSATLGISLPTLKNYLWYMQKTYIVDKVTPFFRNIRKEITKSPVYYFTDLGMRNFALGIFGKATAGGVGYLFENFIYNLLKQKIENSSTQIHFWRTKDRAEVDFVVDTGSELIPIEVKYREIKKPEISRSLHNFIARYKPNKGFLVHLGGKMVKDIDGCAITFLPFPEFAFIDLANN